MSGGEILDKRVDWVSVTKEYLSEMRGKIDFLTHKSEELEDQVATLLAELAGERMKYRRPPVYRKAA